MWFDPVGIFPWKALGHVLLWVLLIGAIVLMLVVSFQKCSEDKASYRETSTLCQDKVKAMKLHPIEARTAYDLCKETDGRLP
jgi:hypothetical protein